jgi:amidase
MRNPIPTPAAAGRLPASTTARPLALLVVLGAVFALLTALLRPPLEAAPVASFPIDLERATVPALQAALADGTITSEQLTAAYLERIKALNWDAGPSLNAVRSLADDAMNQAERLDDERAAGSVRGPLHGIPILIKDNIDLEGLPTTAGALALANSFPDDDAFVVERMEEAGAIILGKTNLSEFANFLTNGMPSGYSGLGGQVLNPYDVSQTPSGSSSGSGTAAAAALAAITVGTETSGSILSPANAAALVGVKPTVGLVSRDGIIPIAASQDTAGPMARSVYDAAALLTAMDGVDPADPVTSTSAGVVGTDYTAALSTTALDGARIGVTVSNPNATQQAAFAALTAQGATLVPVSVQGGGLPASILEYEFKRDLNAYFDTLPDDAPMQSLADVIEFNVAHQAEGTIKFGHDLLVSSQAIELEDPATKATYEANRDNGIAMARQRIDTVLQANDLDAILYAGSGSAGIGARAQYPSVGFPVGFNPDNGRPIGVTLLGTAFSEARLLALAYDYEQATNVWQPPSVVNPSLFRCTDLTDTAETNPLLCPPEVVIDKVAPEVTVTGVTDGGTYGDSQDVTIGWTVTDSTSGPGASTATLDGEPIANGTAIELYTLPLGEHTLAISATDVAGNPRTIEITFTTETTFADVDALIAEFRAEDGISPHAAASLLDRLGRATTAAAAGNEKAAIGNLEQFVARARNQLRSDPEVQAVLVRDAQALIAGLRAVDETEGR